MSERTERRELAKAIAVRDEARAARDEAHKHLVACIGDDPYGYSGGGERSGERYEDARHVVRKAQELLDGLVAERAELEARGVDRVRVHREFIQRHGGNADDVIGNARDACDIAEKDFAVLDVQKVRLEVELDEKEDVLRRAERVVAHEIDNLVQSRAVEAINELWDATHAALVKLGALNVIMNNVNLQHAAVRQYGHPYRDAHSLFVFYDRFLGGTSIREEIERLRKPQEAGAAPWCAAIEKLKSDAYAPLPIAEPPHEAKAA